MDVYDKKQNVIIPLNCKVCGKPGEIKCVWYDEWGDVPIKAIETCPDCLPFSEVGDYSDMEYIYE